MMVIELDYHEITDDPSLYIAEGARHGALKAESARIAGELPLKKFGDVLTAKMQDSLTAELAGKKRQLVSRVVIDVGFWAFLPIILGASPMDEEHKRMCWASRRGMLELDLVLEPFVRDRYPGLDDRDKRLYRALMERQDQELFAWFLKKEVPDDSGLAKLVNKILAATRSARNGI